MRKNIVLFFIFVVFFIIVFLVFFVNPINFKIDLKEKIFVLSCDQVNELLKDNQPICTKLESCNLLPGDILIRRYITSRTRLFVTFANPYFTHSAIYIGNDQIAEAVGNERNSEDEIKVNNLSKSSWLDAGMVIFVVIRPKEDAEKVNKVIEKIRDIANDPDYVFGLEVEGEKRITCAELIFNPMLEEGIIDNKDPKYIVTPDYLFWLTIQNKKKFEIIGYNIEC